MTAPPIHYQKLHEFIVQALTAQKPRTAYAAAVALDARNFEILSDFDLDDDGQPILDSLSFIVRIKCGDGWAALCTVHWSLLSLEWADVLNELDAVLRQHEDGTYPGGPNDPLHR